MNRLQQLERYRKINELKAQREIYLKLVEEQKLNLTFPKGFFRKKKVNFSKLLKNMERS